MKATTPEALLCGVRRHARPDDDVFPLHETIMQKPERSPRFGGLDSSQIPANSNRSAG
jgi:hypothetical protein